MGRQTGAQGRHAGYEALSIYAQAILEKGEAEASRDFTDVHLHLMEGCEACRADLEDALGILRRTIIGGE